MAYWWWWGVCDAGTASTLMSCASWMRLSLRGWTVAGRQAGSQVGFEISCHLSAEPLGLVSFLFGLTLPIRSRANREAVVVEEKMPCG